MILQEKTMGVDLFQAAGITPPNLNANASQTASAPANNSGGVDLFQAAGINPNAQPQQKAPWYVPDQMAHELAPINVGAARFGGNILSDVGKLTGSQALQNTGQQVVQNAPQTFGLTNPDLRQTLLEGASQYAPYGLLQSMIPAAGLTGKAASLLQGTAAGTAFGATQNPNEPWKGAAVGGALGFGSEFLPILGSGASKLAQKFQPDSLRQQIMSGLSQGRGLQENAQSLASDIQNTFQSQKDQGSALYQPVFDAVGDSPIYKTNQAGAYPNLDQDTFNTAIKSQRSISKMNDNFMANPTFQNAHDFQSQLGYEIRGLQNKDNVTKLDTAESNKLDALQDARTSLLGDMNNFLQKTNPQLADQYSGATSNWEQNVTPYYANRDIYKIANGSIVNPDNLTSIFKNPEPDTLKIIKDLPSDASNKILYSYLGKAAASKDPQSLVNSFNKLDEAGLSSFATPSLSQQIDQLSGRITSAKVGQHIAGLGAGVGLGHFLPMEGAEVLGGMAGSYLGPYTAKLLSKLSPSVRSNPALGAAARNAYSYPAKALIGSMIGGNQ